MKVPRIDPDRDVPPILLKEVNLDRYPKLASEVLSASTLVSEYAEKEDHFKSYFSSRLGRRVMPESKFDQEGWAFSFKLKKVHESGAELPDLSPVGFVIAALTTVLLPESVTVTGTLRDHRSGNLLAKRKLSNSTLPRTYQASQG